MSDTNITTPKHTLTITLSQAAQAAALRAGQPAAAEQRYEIPTGEVGHLLDMEATVGADGAVHINGTVLARAAYRAACPGTSWNPPALDARPADAAEAVAAVEALVAAARADGQAEAARQVAEKAREKVEALAQRQKAAWEWLAQSRIVAHAALPEVAALATALERGEDPGTAEYARRRGGTYHTGLWGAADDAVERAQRAARQGRARDWLAGAGAAWAGLPEVRALVEDLGRGGDPDESFRGDVPPLRRAQDAVAAAIERAEMAAWATAHGSERLRLAIAAGVECGATYRDERRAVECPGWTTSPGATSVRLALRADAIGKPDEPRNPPLAALRALASAGEGIALRHVTTYRHDPSHEDADQDGDVRDGDAYVLAREWRGETLYRAAVPEGEATATETAVAAE